MIMKLKYTEMAEGNPRVRLLQDFLIPNLDNGTFHDKLCWEDRNKGLFRIFWRHQSSSRFSPEDSVVFKEWAVAKRLWDPKNPRGPTIYKQRMRAALLKLKNVKCVSKECEYRIYKILMNATTHSQEGTDTSFLSDSSYTSDDSINEIMDYAYLESDHFIDRILQTNYITDIYALGLEIPDYRLGV